MRILLVCAAFHPRGLGGGPEASYLIAKSLVELGIDLQVVTVGERDAVEDYRGIPVHVIKSPNIYWDYLRTNRGPVRKAIWHLLEGFNPRAYLRMRRVLRAYRPSVVMTVSIENVNVATWLLAKMHGIPVVHVLHSYFLMCWRGSMFRRGSKCVGQCLDCKCISAPKKTLSRLVDGVFGESHFVLERHVENGYFGDALRSVIPSGLASMEARSTKRRSGPLVVGYMGVLAPHKGVDTLARAAAGLDPTSFHFLVAGMGDAAYTDDLKSAFGPARVDFLGWVDPTTTYPRFDVLVVPSRWNEPFGRIVIEAMAYGIPVICSDSGGAHESIVDGVSGRVFRTDDVDMLDGLLRVMEEDEDRRHAMGTEALAAAGRFDLAAVAIEMREFIDRVMHGAAATVGSIDATRRPSGSSEA